MSKNKPRNQIEALIPWLKEKGIPKIKLTLSTEAKDKAAKLGMFLILIICSTIVFAQTCPPEGAGRNDKEKTLNIQKNRPCSIGGVTVDSISIGKILASGNDQHRFSTAQLVTVVGYVILQKSGGAESCNCHAKDKSQWDVHLEIAANPKDLGTKAFIAEVTPKYPGRNRIDWKAMTGHKVQVTGFMFFDQEHLQNAVNTNPDGGNVWRRTCWELHPVISIEILD